MDTTIKENINSAAEQKLVKDLYERYASRLLNYTLKNYKIPEDDARNLVYKTIYRIAEINDRYSFENEHKKTAFIFKTHINYLRNYYRDNKSFESRNSEVDINSFEPANNEAQGMNNPRLRLLQKLLDKMEDWQRILLLMRGQGISYREIGEFVNKPEKQLKVYYGRLKQQLMVEMNEILNKQNK